MPEVAEGLRPVGELFTPSQWQALLGASTGYIEVTDALGRILYVNRPMAGLDDPEIVGKNLVDTVPMADRHAMMARIERVLTSGVSEPYTYALPTTNGDIWLQCSIARQQDEAGDRLIIVGQDITERVESQQALLEANERHAQLERKLQIAQLHDSLAGLAGGLAHDFNNLLGAILANVWYVMTTLPKGSQHRIALEEAQAATDRAAALCRELQTYAGQTQGKADQIDLKDLVVDMSRLLTPNVSRKAQLLFSHKGDPATIKGNPAQIRQLIANLVTNASEALAGGSGQIRIETAFDALTERDLSHAIVETGLLPGEYAVIRVTDTGIGMDEETQRRAFEPFFTTRFNGRGLGLAAVLGIVRAHGGTLLCESSAGVGSKFTVVMPALTVRPSNLQLVPKLMATKRTILVADDELWVRAACARILEREGYKVLEAANGREAVDLIHTHGSEIGCVLLDLSMPELDGNEAMLLIRATRPGIPIVLMTGRAESEKPWAEVEHCDFLTKPFLPDSLLEKVHGVLLKTA